MNNKAVMGVAAAVVVGAGFFLFYNSRSRPVTGQANPTNEPTQGQNVITLTENGFLPQTLTVKSGSEITWVNKSDKEMQIGVNSHPIHAGNREISGGEFTLDLAPGQEKTVAVEKTGTFSYHNHLGPNQTGIIIVR